MSPPTIALATASAHPDLWLDDQPLLAALRAHGARATPTVWDDPAVDWAAFDAVVVRSTWDYVPRRDAFVAWADHVGAVSTLRNPPGIVRWNTDKTYLRDLAAAHGLPVVPTLWAEEPTDLAAAVSARRWSEAVVKPAVSAGAVDTLRFRPEDAGAAQDLLDRLVARGTAMVQPYLASVESYGERSLVYLDGALSHAVRRAAALDPAVTDRYDAVPVEPAGDETELAARVLDAVGAPLLYARVDLARDDDGRPCLMELELVEPQLFLRHAPGAAERLAEAILRSLGERAGSGGRSTTTGS